MGVNHPESDQKNFGNSVLRKCGSIHEVLKMYPD